MAIVAELFFYPVKSARAVAAPSLRLTTTGFEWDRHWMAIDSNGTFMSQRTHPRLARIEPEIGDGMLTLQSPGLAPMRIPLEPLSNTVGNTVPVTVWKDPCRALDQGDAAGEWLSEALGESARLVRVTPSMGRMANPAYAGSAPAPVSFTDGFPLLVCNRASLAHLNTRMPEPIPMQRFRPNIVLEGLEPFAEDRIAELRIGDVTLRLVKPCTRCVITSTDQRTGERSTNPLPVLREFRFDRALLGVTFGENAVIAAGVGASVERGAECSVAFEA
jgi:uncharacterized protein YcbX